MRGYCACHPSPVLIGPPLGLFAVDDGPAQFGVCGVDRGVDDRNHDSGSERHAVGFSQTKLRNDILGNIARCRPLVCDCIILQCEQIVRLRYTDSFALKRSDDVVELPAITEPEMKYAAVQERQSLGADRRYPQAGGQGERSLLLVGADVHKHFVGNKPRLTARRNAGEAGLARKRAPRQTIASKRRRSKSKRWWPTQCSRNGGPGVTGLANERMLRQASAGGMAETGMAELGMSTVGGATFPVACRNAGRTQRRNNNGACKNEDAGTTYQGLAPGF
jgi:hypothetical protein